LVNINTIYVGAYYAMESTKTDAEGAEAMATSNLGVEVGMGF
jgi:hypothetical protein